MLKWESLQPFLVKIRPAVDDETTITEERHSGNSEFVERVSVINVKRTVKVVIERSPILKEMIESGQIGIVGGTHDITTGEVIFYSDAQFIR